MSTLQQEEIGCVQKTRRWTPNLEAAMSLLPWNGFMLLSLTFFDNVPTFLKLCINPSLIQTSLPSLAVRHKTSTVCITLAFQQLNAKHDCI